MNKHLPLLAFGLLLGAVAQETPPTPTTPPATTPPSTAPAKPSKLSQLIYKSPKTTMTGKRIDGDGGIREGLIKYPKWITTLTPGDGPALTTLERPSLFAFISDQTPHEVRFTITDPEKTEPAFVLAVSQCGPGIRRVNLVEYGLSLPVGKELKWSFIVRPDQQNKSADLMSVGYVKRIQPDPELVKRLKEAPISEHAAIYAEAGIWYDALAVLSDQIAANPNDADLLAMRQAFLEQGGVKFRAEKSADGSSR